MKKWIIIFVSLILITIILIYTLVPGTISVSRYIELKGSRDAVFRNLKNDAEWASWWPGGSPVAVQNGAHVYTLDKDSFWVKKTFFSGFYLGSSVQGYGTESILVILPMSNDSIKVTWHAAFNTSVNPVIRFKQYLHSKKLDNAFGTILYKLKKYVSNRKNLYGFDIKEDTVHFEYLISTKEKFNHYPSEVELYAMIESLKKHAETIGGKYWGNPLQNISSSGNTGFEAQVAIPVDSNLPSSDQFSAKWMLKRGNIITCEVKGGPHTVERAMRATGLFVDENNRSRIAMPFQELITNRLTETDTSKWVTKVYYPVI